MKTNIKLLAAVLLLSGLSYGANANLITNGSFENGAYTCGNPAFCTLGAGSTAITGWTIDTGSVDWINNYWQNADGTKSIDINGNTLGAFSASTSFNTDLGKQYLLSFAMSGNPDGAPTNKQIDVDIQKSGGSPAISALFSYDISSYGNKRADMKWMTQSLVFSGMGGATELSFTSLYKSAYGAAIDNVSVREVPEPASLALMLLALGLGAGALRRKT